MTPAELLGRLLPRFRAELAVGWSPEYVDDFIDRHREALEALVAEALLHRTTPSEATHRTPPRSSPHMTRSSPASAGSMQTRKERLALHAKALWKRARAAAIELDPRSVS